MKVCHIVCMTLAMSGGSVAQQGVPASASRSGANGASTAQTEAAAGAAENTQTAKTRIAPGSVIPVQLTTAVDAKKARTGEQVTAKVTQDLRTSDGRMLMPKDTEIVGHITESQARNKQDKESQVGIVFDHAVMNNASVSYPLSIQAVISPEVFQNNGGNGAPQAPSSAPSSSMPAQTPGGRGGMGGGQAGPPAGNAGGAESGGSGNQPPAITGQTQGMVGFSHLKLETPGSPAQGSVISSEKNNVKLDNGTLMLLRVNQ